MKSNVFQTLSWLTPAPADLDECMQSEPKHLKALFQHHKVISNTENQNWARGSTLGKVYLRIKFLYISKAPKQKCLCCGQ